MAASRPSSGCVCSNRVNSRSFMGGSSFFVGSDYIDRCERGNLTGFPKKPSPEGEGGPAGPDEGRVCRDCPFPGCRGTPAPHQSAGGAADSFPRGGSLSRVQKNRRRFHSVCFLFYCPAGRVNTNRHHLPSSLSAWICPPERLMRILQICSPSPLPRVFMPRERSSL